MPIQPEQRSLANQRVMQIFNQAAPAIIDIQTARDVIPNMADDLILHAGPPITWADMAGPMQGAVMGAAVYEGLAPDLDAARRLLDRGEIRIAPNHDHHSVAPMAGVISASMPVWVIEDPVNHTRAYSNLNEGPGAALRYGANNAAVIDRLRWMEKVLAPRLREAVCRLAPLPIFPIVREALHMGDECHSRNRAALTLLIQALLPGLLKTALTTAEIDEMLGFMIGRDYFFLNLTMASCKAAWLAAEAVPDASIVTAFSRNGVEFSIRVQGRWFPATSPIVTGHYFPEFTAVDANRDLGDSAITEASGLGGFAVGGAPAITDFIGGTVEYLTASMLDMYKITVGESTHFDLAMLGGRGTPSGVDIYRVIETGIQPIITTGIAHRLPGVGQVGAGYVRAPLECFTKAAQFVG